MLLSTGLFSLCLFPWLIQGLPNLLSIFLSFLDDFGRRCATGCNRIQEFCDRSCVYNGYNMYRLDPCSSCYNRITTMRNAEYQSKYNLQLLYKFHGRIDYWKCVYVTFDLFIVFCTFLGKYDTQILFFWRKPSEKDYLSIPFLWVLGRCVPLILKSKFTPANVHRLTRAWGCNLKLIVLLSVAV